MFTPTRRLVCMVRMLALACLIPALVTPAAAQFGGLKKKAQQAAGAEAAKKVGDTTATQKGAAPAPAAGAGGGGDVVLDDKVVGQLIAGLKAGQAEREAGKKGDNPYGRYHRDVAAYEAAKAKCEEAQADWGRRAATDEKLLERHNAYVERMMKAQQAGDNDKAQAISDSAKASIDPSCVAKQPNRPDNYYDAEREVENRAEQRVIQESGLSRSEMAMAMEKSYTILLGGREGGIETSASEKSAVNNRSAELKPLLGLEEKPAARAAKPAPAPAPPPPPTPSGPTMSDDQTRLSECMAKNAKKHEKEIEALGERTKAAAEANDMARTMAIADTIRQLQTAGCQ
jgi:hypothetical protein